MKNQICLLNVTVIRLLQRLLQITSQLQMQDFRKKDLDVLRLNVNSVLPKIDYIHYIRYETVKRN